MRRPMIASGAAVAIALAACLVGAAPQSEPGETTTIPYYVGDFVGGPTESGRIDMTPIMRLIRDATGREHWKADGEASGVGGTMTPFFLNNSLIIRQNEAIHGEIRQLLRNLRELPPFKTAPRS